MSAMKDLSFSQEEVMLETYLENQHDKAHGNFNITNLRFMGGDIKVKEAFELGFMLGRNAGMREQLEDTIKIIKSKRVKK